MQKKLSRQELWLVDAFQEMGNVGGGSALTMLSHVIDKEMTVSLPSVLKLESERILEMVRSTEENMLGVLFPFKGDISGKFLLLFEEEFVKTLLESAGRQEVSGENGLRFLTVKEIASLMASSYFTAISAYTGMEIEISLPAVAEDMAGVLLLDTLKWFTKDDGNAACIISEFTVENRKKGNYLLMAMDTESALCLVKALGGTL